MKIGVWLNSSLLPEMGGSHSYYSLLIKSICKYPFSDELDICFIVEGDNLPVLSRPVISLSHTPPRLTLLERIKCKIPGFRSKMRLYKEKRDELSRINAYSTILRLNGIRLIYYPTPCAIFLTNYPFVMTHWDIGHRSTYAFPEVIGDDTFADRENFYNNILPRALMVFCESNTGKEELVRLAHFNEKKIRVVPLFAGVSASTPMDQNSQNNTLHHFNLSPNKFFYYPAQFWAHKNHYTLLKAFSAFINYHGDYKLVFTGSDQGNQKYIKKMSTELNLENYVLFAGFVGSETVGTLYRNATAMIMPTMLGPTNMPLLEAMECGCPVICSDTSGHREELGDAAIYVNPINATEIVSAMNTMIEQREEYVEKIKAQSQVSTFKINKAMKRIDQYLCEAVTIRDTWE